MVSKENEEEKQQEIMKAKRIELGRWIEEAIFEKVPDKGLDRVTTTWVITSKSKEEGIVTKARLVVRGYEEDT